MKLQLVCHACDDLVLQADTEDELVTAATEHARSAHGHAPPREHVLGRIRRHNH
jgi:predicted small metal-binding protein